MTDYVPDKDYDGDTVVMLERLCEGLEVHKKGVKIVKSPAHKYLAMPEQRTDSLCETHKHIAESYLKMGYTIR